MLLFELFIGLTIALLPVLSPVIPVVVVMIMIRKKSGIPDGQSSSDPLSTGEKIGNQEAYALKTGSMAYVLAGNNIYMILDESSTGTPATDDPIYPKWISSFEFSTSTQ